MNIISITNLRQYIDMSAKQNSLRDGVFYKNSKLKKDIYVPAPKIRDNDEERGKKLRSIFGKMAAGKKLSSADMEYLRENAPEWYEKARRIEQEREQYRRALENCKTKDQARLLQTQRMSQVMAEYKAAKASKDADAMSLVSMKAAAFINEFTEFTKTDEYDELPNEYEIVAEMIEEQKERLQNEEDGDEDGFEFENEEDGDEDGFEFENGNNENEGLKIEGKDNKITRNNETGKTDKPSYPDNKKIADNKEADHHFYSNYKKTTSGGKGKNLSVEIPLTLTA